MAGFEMNGSGSKPSYYSSIYVLCVFWCVSLTIGLPAAVSLFLSWWVFLRSCSSNGSGCCASVCVCVYVCVVCVCVCAHERVWLCVSVRKRTCVRACVCLRARSYSYTSECLQGTCEHFS